MPDDLYVLSSYKAGLNYLMYVRGFSRQDSMWLTKRYKLGCTGCEGFFEYGEEMMDLSLRIIAPIFHKNKVVSWQSRDITENAFLKYITCPASVEIIEHKKVLYNAPDPDKYKIIILCEGIVDVWKVVLSGFPATCCFGVEYTYEQLKLLLQYDKVRIFLDPDKAGMISAKKLIKQIIFAGKDAEIVKNLYGCDPGEMTKKLIRKILK